MKNWYLLVTDVSDKNVKNWNRMQNATDLRVFFVNVMNTHVYYMKIDFTKCEILV